MMSETTLPGALPAMMRSTTLTLRDESFSPRCMEAGAGVLDTSSAEDVYGAATDQNTSTSKSPVEGSGSP